MNRKSWGLVAGWLASAACVAFAIACQAPTQGTLAIYTDMPCTPIRVEGARNALTDFRIYTAATREGLQANLANGLSVASGKCSEGNRGRTLGNLALSGKGTVFVAVRAGTWTQGGVATSEAECSRTPEACIVAERSLVYAQNQNLDVPVTLDEKCSRVVCTGGNTCLEGQCVSVPQYSASSPAPAPPQEQPALQDLDGGMSMIDASDAPMLADAGLDAGPVLPQWYAVCRNGTASLEEYPMRDGGTRAAPNCRTAGSIVCAQGTANGYEPCLGSKIDTSLYRVCCSVTNSVCCMVPSALGGPGIPLLNVASLPSAVCSTGGALGVSKSPCFAPNECASGICTMLKAADGTALGYGQCL
jgi:hypothetical protein